jgi:ribosomal protein L11 methyltransferase
MPSYSLSVLVAPDMKDPVIANGYAFGMTGCVEEEIPAGTHMTCYYPALDLMKAAQMDLSRRFPSLEIAVAEIADTDWNAQWKASMTPALVAPGIWVSPLWLSPPLAGEDHWIKIEPKTAFGTGHHATTRLAAAKILSLHKTLPSGFSLLDIGTGTGVLCFVSRICGAGHAIGIDNDPACLENLVENRANNPSMSAGGFFIGGLDMFKHRPMFDCIVMNMLQIESQPLLEGVFRLLKPSGHLVWSGILIEEKNNVISDASQKGFIFYEESIEDEWWCGSFSKD